MTPAQALQLLELAIDELSHALADTGDDEDLDELPEDDEADADWMAGDDVDDDGDDDGDDDNAEG